MRKRRRGLSATAIRLGATVPVAAFVVFLVLGSIAYDVLCPIGAMLGAGYGAADLILIFSAM